MKYFISLLLCFVITSAGITKPEDLNYYTEVTAQQLKKYTLKEIAEDINYLLYLVEHETHEKKQAEKFIDDWLTQEGKALEKHNVKLPPDIDTLHTLEWVLDNRDKWK